MAHMAHKTILKGVYSLKSPANRTGLADRLKSSRKNFEFPNCYLSVRIGHLLFAGSFTEG